MSYKADPRILQMTLHKKWFDKILSGRKRYEFREFKPYWTKRLEGKEYDVIRFKNGYNRDARVMKVEYCGYQIRTVKGKKLYCIRLGKMLSSPS